MKNDDEKSMEYAEKMKKWYYEQLKKIDCEKLRKCLKDYEIKQRKMEDIMSGINSCVLVGRLTKDVQERRTQKGTPVVSFTLAVDRRNKDDGADFIPCIAWDKAAETISKYVHKGDLFAVTGYIQVRSYEKDGRMNYATEVVTTGFQFLERKREMPSDGPSVQNNSDIYDGWGNDIDSSELPF